MSNSAAKREKIGTSNMLQKNNFIETSPHRLTDNLNRLSPTVSKHAKIVSNVNVTNNNLPHLFTIVSKYMKSN